MEARRLPDAGAFLDATVALRGRDPLRTNVLGSVATIHARGLPWREECFWWVVADGDEVVGAAMRTPPFPVGISPMPSTALEALAARVVLDQPSIPGLSGMESDVEAYLSHSARCGGPGPDDVVERLPQLLYEAPSVRLVEVDGSARVATLEDLELLATWTDGFSREAHGVRADDNDERRAQLATTVGDGRFTLWTLEGAPVSLAGHAVPVETPSGTVTRVGPVYTPPELRRRGFAGAVTGEVTRRILEAGSRAILYTDALNPTSNHVYQDLGYELVDRWTHTRLAEH